MAKGCVFKLYVVLIGIHWKIEHYTFKFPVIREEKYAFTDVLKTLPEQRGAITGWNPGSGTVTDIIKFGLVGTNQPQFSGGCG